MAQSADGLVVSVGEAVLSVVLRHDQAGAFPGAWHVDVGAGVKVVQVVISVDVDEEVRGTLIGDDQACSHLAHGGELKHRCPESAFAVTLEENEAKLSLTRLSVAGEAGLVPALDDVEIVGDGELSLVQEGGTREAAFAVVSPSSSV